MTDAIAAALIVPSLAKATGTAREETSCAVTMCEETFDCKEAQATNNNTTNIGAKFWANGAIDAVKNCVKPISLLVIAKPRTSVEAAKIKLGQDTPFVIASLILIKGFLFPVLWT
jgi:hypothetical protein